MLPPYFFLLLFRYRRNSDGTVHTIMKNWIPITGIVALLASGGYWLTIYPGTVGATTAPAASASPASLNAALVSGSDSTAPLASTAADTAAASKDKTANMQATTSGVNGALSSRSLTPALTRLINPPQTLQMEDRKWAVLGTRDVAQATGQIKVLVLREEASGQLDYRQSALRFMLQPGTDYEAFIRGRRNAQRLFVNAMYGEVAVDAAYIADEYTALSQDKRVVKVQFMPLVVPVKPR